MRSVPLVIVGPPKQKATFVQSSAYLSMIYAEIGLVDDLTLEAVFNTVITASDYSLGFSIDVNAVDRPVISAALQPDLKTIHFTIGSYVANGDTVTLSYNAAVGDVHSLFSVFLASFTDSAVTNNVPMHSLKYNRRDNSMYMGLIRRV